MHPIVRSVVAILGGVIAGVVLISAIQRLGHVFYPQPPDFDLKDHEAVKALMNDMPLGGFLMLLLGYAAGTLGGAWLAAKLAGRARVRHGLVVGLFFLLASVANLVMIPFHPVWFIVVNLLLIMPAAYAGGKLAY
jgi:hypothetical protein